MDQKIGGMETREINENLWSEGPCPVEG